MIKVTLITGLLFLLFSSCDLKQHSVEKEKVISTLAKTTDTVLEADLKRATSFYNNFIIKNNQLVGQVKIDSLNHQYDSLQIRLWIIGGLYPSRQLYIIKTSNSIWTGLYYEMEPDSNYITGRGSNEFLKGPAPYEITKTKKIKPKCGWTKFVDSLISLNILTLPDMEEIPEMKPTGTDAGNGIIEISSKSNFRFYGYFDAIQLADKFWQADKMAKIESLFFKELQR
jgi:hypothetical protein